MGILNFQIESLIYILPAFVLALTVHEYAHARVAYSLGDPTAYNAGRLTLNPLKHLDIIGSLMLVFVGFGWAKPVPVNPYYFRGDRRKGMMAVSVAGPLSNLIQAFILTIIFALLWRFAPSFLFGLNSWPLNFIHFFIHINLVLCIFNLLPLPPLDGSKILAGILPERHGRFIYTLEQYGYLILLALVLLGVVREVIFPIVSFLFRLLMNMASFIINI